MKVIILSAVLLVSSFSYAQSVPSSDVQLELQKLRQEDRERMDAFKGRNGEAPKSHNFFIESRAAEANQEKSGVDESGREVIKEVEPTTEQKDHNPGNADRQ